MVKQHAAVLLAAAAIVLVACSSAAPPAGSGRPPGTVGGPSAATSGCVVGVSWADLTGRWAMWDEPAVKKALDEAGATYISNDAKGSAEMQATNVESLISKGAKVLIINAQGSGTAPSVASATRLGIPVIAYDRLIDDPKALYITFDNVEVGRMQARALLKVAPKGNYMFIKGDKGDANADFLRAGQDEVLAAAIKSGGIKNVGETYTTNWDRGLAQTETEQFLAANGTKVDAVLSENDSMAGGVIAALAAHGLVGKAAVSGQDGDEDALNEVAVGRQTVDVWKDGRILGKTAGEAAIQLCAGATVDQISGTADFTTPAGNSVRSILLKPIPVTKDNLNVVLDAGWIAKGSLCHGVAAGSVAACP